jgi:hypothetical protein
MLALASSVKPEAPIASARPEIAKAFRTFFFIVFCFKILMHTTTDTQVA